MLALIDADIAVYRTAFSCQKKDPLTGDIIVEPEFVAKARFNEMIDGILAETSALEYQLWLSDSTENGFRIKFYPEYKANRPPKPILYDFVKEIAITDWGAQIAIEQEADDALGIQQVGRGFFDGGTIICSIDKDLLQIPGNHYNFVKKEKSFVTPDGGRFYFYTQLLTGDTSDNIQGCPGVGVAKAAKFLAGLSTEESLFQQVVNIYKTQYKTKCKIEDEPFVMDQILQNGRCLKIRTEEEEIWNFPVVNAS